MVPLKFELAIGGARGTRLEIYQHQKELTIGISAYLACNFPETKQLGWSVEWTTIVAARLGALMPMEIPHATGPVAGSFPTQWIHGLEFLFLLFGSERVVLPDTGANMSQLRFRCVQLSTISAIS